MTADRDGKSRRTGQPDLLASLPAEGPPASRPDPGIDPAVIEELLTEVRNLREQVAGLKEAVSTERSTPEPAPVPTALPEAVPEVLTLEALEAWGDRLVARVAEAAPKDDAASAVADHVGRIEEAAARAAAAAERIDGGLGTTGDRVVAEIRGAATSIEKPLQTTRDHVSLKSRLVHKAVEELRTIVAGPRFGLGAVLVFSIVFVLVGVALERYAHIPY